MRPSTASKRADGLVAIVDADRCVSTCSPDEARAFAAALIAAADAPIPVVPSTPTETPKGEPCAS